jgi:signal transduction histidine kinase
VAGDDSSLADFLETHHAEVLSEWEAFARTLFPPGEERTATTVRDHGEEILDAIVADMRSQQTSGEQAEKSMGRGGHGRLGAAGKAHAVLRLEGGFGLGQVVAEYRALRASVLRNWTASSGARDLEGLIRFNEAIDEALTEATDRFLEMLERHRDEFLGILGHDLRNPLNAIVMSASTLHDLGAAAGAPARVAERILRSATRMGRLIADLLDLTRTRLGLGIPIVPALTDLGAVCHQVVAELEAGHPGHPVRFQAEGDLDGEWDSARLAQVVSNLVGNALEHGAKESPVDLVARQDDGGVELEIHNEGPPIPEEELHTIFEPMRSHGRDETASSHLGLGLYIAEQVVAAHGGTIAVTSTPVSGTTFTIHLPRRPAGRRS